MASPNRLSHQRWLKHPNMCEYKITINQVTKHDIYPLSWMEILFAALAGGKIFSKLNLTHTNQQLVFADESKKICHNENQQKSFPVRKVTISHLFSPCNHGKFITRTTQNLCISGWHIDDRHWLRGSYSKPI